MTDDITIKITAAHVKDLLVEEGLEVRNGGSPSLFHVARPGRRQRVTCLLQGNVLFNTLRCGRLDATDVSIDLLHTLLDPENGILTSSFRLRRRPDDAFDLILINSCKLQNLGAEDRDDLLSCLAFLETDAARSRRLVAPFRHRPAGAAADG